MKRLDQGHLHPFKVIARHIRLGWWIRTRAFENDAIKGEKSEEN